MAENPTQEIEYDDAMVAFLELIWGEGFLSNDCPEMVHTIVEGLELKDKEVLDIGCGIGGVDVVLARDYGCRVLGLDIEKPLIERARAVAADFTDRIEFRLVERGPLPVDDASFDVVFSKDSRGHIPSMDRCFADVLRVLKRGGTLAASDWCRGPDPYSDDMHRYIEVEGVTINFDTLEQYGVLLRDCGFVDVALTDISDSYRVEARAEYERVKGPLKQTMIAALGREKQEHFLENWRLLSLVLDKGELRTGLIRARKPA